MDFRYAFVYATVNLFCIVTALIILFKISYNIGSEHEMRIFRGMTLCFLGFVVLELIWSLSIAGVAPIPARTSALIKIVSTILIPIMVWLWVQFAETKFRSRFATSRAFKIISMLPLLALLALYVVSIRTGIVFSISPDGDLINGPMAVMTGVVDNIYGAFIIIHAIILLVREKLVFRRRVYTTHIIFIVICTIGGIVDASVGNTPIMPLAIALAFNFLFMNLLEGQIYNDALTGLNNRRSADRYLDEAVEAVSEEDPFHLFILDVDRFKQINDTMGHLEGDRALQAVAAAISNATEEYRGFSARWGGDEFVILIRGQDTSFPEVFVPFLQSQLDQQRLARNLSYPLRISAGSAYCTSSTQRASELIRTADQMLYQEKSRNQSIRSA